jgi:long-subunit acyl-CoA synthetase (AMP-forming)
MSNIIVSTSGTSGLSKQAVLTPEIMAARVATTSTANGKNIADCKVIYVAKASMSSSFQRYKAWADVKGIKLIQNVSADNIINTFKNEGVDGIIGVPGLLKLVASLYEKTGTSAGLKQVVVGHASLNRMDGIYIQQWLGKDLQVGYGATEIGTICSGTFEEVYDIEGCVGKPVEGVTVEILEGGVIRIKSETMVTSYEDYEEMDAIHFKNGWFYPGDKGYFTKDGRLVITKNR